MTRKDYVNFAGALGHMKRMWRGNADVMQALDEMSMRMCIVFREDNPKFDSGRFHNAVAEFAKEKT